MSTHAPIKEVEEPADQERVPASTHHARPLRVDQVVVRLFPLPTRGHLFYTRFLERASQNKTTLPDEPADTVVICTTSIATLAQELGVGHDTTQKYVVIYRALGLLKKRKLMGKLAFVMRTGTYHPPDLLEANLTYLLQKSRPKLREMTSDVLARCKIYGLIAQDLQAAVAHLQDLLQPQPGETRRTLEQRLLSAQQVFGQVLVSLQSLPDTHKRIDAQWLRFPGAPPLEAAESPHTKPPGRREEYPASRMPSLRALEGDSAASQSQRESPQVDQSGRCDAIDPAPNPPHVPHHIDSVQPQTAQESTQNTTSGRFEQEGAASRLPQTPRQGDSTLANPHTRGVESPLVEREGRRGDRQSASNPPDDAPQRDSSDPANVNVSIKTVIDSLNVNVKLVVEYLCTSFKEGIHKRGYYYNLYKEHRRPEAWLAAALETLVGLHRDRTVEEPGRLFYGLCVTFHQQGVPAEAADLVRQYGNLTYVQLLEALQQPLTARAGPPSRQPPVPRRAACGSSIQRALPRDKQRAGMSRTALGQVLAGMSCDERTCDLFTQPYLQADGSCALLIDDGMGHQRWIYSLPEWQESFARIHTMRDLFPHAQKTARR